MLQALSDKHVLSAPVLTGDQPDTPSKSASSKFKEDREVVGFLDIRDILVAFMDHLGGLEHLLQMPLAERLRHVEGSGAAFSNKAVKESVRYGDDGNFLYFGKVGIWLIENHLLLIQGHRARHSRFQKPLTAHRSRCSSQSSTQNNAGVVGLRYVGLCHELECVTSDA